MTQLVIINARRTAACVLILSSLLRLSSVQSFGQDDATPQADAATAAPVDSSDVNPVAATEVDPVESTNAEIPKEQPAGKPESPAESDASEEPKPNKPIVEEPDEALVKDWLSAVVDNSMYLQNRELPAYRHLVNSVSHQSYEDLKSKAIELPSFNYFYKKTSENRGTLVDMDVNIRRVQKLELDDSDSFEAKQLYEIWGFNQQSKTRLYVFITPELPEGIKEGLQVNFHSRFAGYFFKLQGYKAGTLAKGDKLLVAPMLIGQFTPHIPVVAPQAEFTSWPIFVLIICLILVVFFRFSRLAGLMGGMSSIFPARLREDAGKPTDSDNLDWVGTNMGTAEKPKDEIF